MQSAFWTGLAVAMLALPGCTADDDAVVNVGDAAPVVQLDATVVPVTTDASLPPDDDAATEPGDATVDDAGAVDAAASDAAKDAANGGDGAVDGGMVTLRIQNYDLQCAISVDNGAVVTTAEEDLQERAGAVVHLTASRASATYVFGYWVGTSGDRTAAHDTFMATTVNVDGDMTVQACCPFATAPSMPCPAPTP